MQGHYLRLVGGPKDGLRLTIEEEQFNGMLETATNNPAVARSIITIDDSPDRYEITGRINRAGEMVLEWEGIQRSFSDN